MSRENRLTGLIENQQRFLGVREGQSTSRIATFTVFYLTHNVQLFKSTRCELTGKYGRNVRKVGGATALEEAEVLSLFCKGFSWSLGIYSKN